MKRAPRSARSQRPEDQSANRHRSAHGVEGAEFPDTVGFRNDATTTAHGTRPSIKVINARVPRVVGSQHRRRGRLRRPRVTTSLDLATCRRATCRGYSHTRRRARAPRPSRRNADRSPYKSARWRSSSRLSSAQGTCVTALTSAFVDARTFLGMGRTGEATWSFDVTERVITPGNFLFGGADWLRRSSRSKRRVRGRRSGPPRSIFPTPRSARRSPSRPISPSSADT